MLYTHTNLMRWSACVAGCAGLMAIGACDDSTAPDAGPDPRWALGWADDEDADAEVSYRIDTDYEFTTGDSITVSRASAGTYAVRFHRLARRSGWKETIQVSAYGNVPARCRVQSWGNDGPDLVAQVRCHNMSGTLTNSRFTILLATADAMEGRNAFALSTSASGGAVSASASFHPAGGAITVERLEAGRYQVQFSGLGDAGITAPESFHVTSYGSGNLWCKLESWSEDEPDIQAIVRCYTPAGTLTDAQFSILLTAAARTGHRLGFARTSSSLTGAVNAAFSLSSSGLAITGVQASTGVYTTTWTGIGRTGSSTAETNLVTAYGSNAVSCQVGGWGGASLDVYCYNTGGGLANSLYTALWIE